MKTNAIVRIVIFSIALLILVGILIAGIAVRYFSFNTNADISEDGEDITNQSTFSAEAVNKVKIDWVAGSITVRPDKSAKEITVSESGYTSDKYQMVCTQSGNTLKINFCKDALNINFGLNINTNISKDLFITVPSDWLCNELEIDAASADLSVNDLTLEKVDIEGASGDCKFDNCQVTTLDMDTASGNVEFFGALESLDFDGASADCNLTLLTAPRRIDIDSMSGDLEISLPTDSGFTVSMDTLTGNFHSDFETRIIAGDYIYGDGSCRININAMSGNVAIYKAN